MGMRVILLGHRGLIGSAFADHLSDGSVELIRVDSENYATVRGMHSDVVINANGSSDRRLASADPMASFRLNDEVTLASLVDLPTHLYVHVSTVGVYPDAADRFQNAEDRPLDPSRMTTYGRFKWISEVLVQGHAESWLIVRVGPVVGPGLRKNSVYDLLEKRTLFFNPASEMPYIDTRDVARIVWSIRDAHDQVFNVAGEGNVKLSDLAKELGVDLPSALWDLPRDDWAVDISKLQARTRVPSSWETVRRFAREWRLAEFSRR
jgi:dTDP-4-dehydrorhamnose reductase